MCFSTNSRGLLRFCVIFAEDVKGESTVEHVAVVMNIVPCRSFNLSSQARERYSSL